MQNYGKPRLCSLPDDTPFCALLRSTVVHETFSSCFGEWVPRVSSPESSSCFDRLGPVWETRRDVPSILGRLP